MTNAQKDTRLQRNCVWVHNDPKLLFSSSLSCARWKFSPHHRALTRNYKRSCGNLITRNGLLLPAKNLATICLSQHSRMSPITWAVCLYNLQIKATAYIPACHCTLWAGCANARMYKKTSSYHLQCQSAVVQKDNEPFTLVPGHARA